MSEVKNVHTGKSMYDGDCVNVELGNGETVRLHVSEIKKLLEDNERKVSLNKKRKRFVYDV